jgi:hypothetical protein
MKRPEDRIDSHTTLYLIQVKKSDGHIVMGESVRHIVDEVFRARTSRLFQVAVMAVLSSSTFTNCWPLAHGQDRPAPPPRLLLGRVNTTKKATDGVGGAAEAAGDFANAYAHLRQAAGATSLLVGHAGSSAHSGMNKLPLGIMVLDEVRRTPRVILESDRHVCNKHYDHHSF